MFTRTGPQGSGRSTRPAWWRPRSPIGTAALATRICTPMSRWRTRCRPSTDAGCPSTDGCCSRRRWRRRRPTTPPWSTTSAPASASGSPNGRPRPEEAADTGNRRRRPRLEPALVDPPGRHRSRRASWPPTSNAITAGHPPRSKRCSWRSRPPWRPARPSTNPAPSPSNERPGWPKPSRCWAAAGPSKPWSSGPCPAARGQRDVDAAWVARRPIGCWRRWRNTAPPGRSGTSAPKRNATSALPAYERRAAEALVDLLVAEVLHSRSAPLARPGRHQRTGGAAAGRRCLGLHRRRIRAVHLTRILDAEQRLVATAGRSDGRTSTQRRWIWRCWNRPPTGSPWTPDRPLWFVPCAPPGRGCSWRSRRPAPGKPPPCAPSPGVDPGGGQRDRAWPRPPPRLRSSATRPAPSRHPGQTHLVHYTTAPARLGGPHRPSTLVMIDEAGMADTLSLDAAVQFIVGRGGSVRLIGDDQQLAAIGAGGVLRDIRHTHGAVRLTELHRFTDPAEAAATLALRDGRPEALGFYLDRQRSPRRRPHHHYRRRLRRLADRPQPRPGCDHARPDPRTGRRPQPARPHPPPRRRQRPAGRRSQLADGNRASVGDLIITRSNDRTTPPDRHRLGEKR